MKHIGKKLLAMLLSITMLLSVCVVDVSAAEPDTAQIGDTTYASLSAALTEATSGQTIQMIANEDISATGLVISKNITLDLNGQTLTANNGNGKITVDSDATLTLQDSASGGKIVTNSDYSSTTSGALLQVNGQFIMNSGNIEALRDNPEDNGQFAVSAMGSNAKITINGGTIKAGWYAISGNGSKTSNSTIAVHGGELISTADYAIYHPQTGTLSIDGGTVYGYAGGICMNNGALAISGGVITSKGTGNTGDWSDGTGNISNAAISLNAKYGDVTASMEKATIAAEGNAIAVASGTTHTVTVSKLDQVTFGVSTKTGLTSTMDTINGYAASDASNTVRLLGDLTLDAIVNVEKNLILEGNNHTISSTASRGICITQDNVSLTLKDLTLDGKNTNQRGVQVNNPGDGLINHATITMDNCTLENFTYYAVNLTLNTIVNLSIEDSTISGWAALNLYSQGYDIKVNNSVLIGTNDKSVSAWNGFGVVVLEGDTTGTTSAHSTNNTVTLTNCTVKALSPSGNNQYPILFNLQSTQNTLTITGEKTKISAPANTPMIVDDGIKNVTSINSGYFSANPGMYTASGYKVFSNDDATFAYRVAKIPANVITAASASVVTTAGEATTQDAAVTISGSTLHVSGSISSANEVLVRYTCTDGKTGLIHIGYSDNAFTASPASVTVGNTTYTLDLSGLKILPEDVKIALPETSAKADSSATNTQGATSAATAISDNVQKVGASGLGAAVTDATVNTSGETTSISVNGEDKTTEEVLLSDAVVNAQQTSGVLATVEKEDLVVVVQPVLNIKVNDLVDEGGNKTLKLDISAQSQVVVTSKDTDTSSISTTGSSANAVPIGDPAPINVTKPIELTIPVPENFITADNYDNIFVAHTMHDGTVKTVKATYDETNHTITFTVNGMSPMDVITDGRACTINYPDSTSNTYRLSDVGTSLPTSDKSGYTFNGWTFHAADGSAIAAADGVYKTLTADLLNALNAKTVNATPDFTLTPPDTYTLRFEVNGGSSISSVSKDSGSIIDLADYSTTRDGYTFVGWFSDADLSEAVSNVTLTADVTVYAKWALCNPFSDVVSGSFCYDSILWATEVGITNGTTPTSFAPNATCSRGQAVTFLWRANGSPEPKTTTCAFTDVKASSYSYKAILWASEEGITLGTSATTFSPNADVSRGQVITFLWRAAGSKIVDASANFTDVDATASYAPAVNWAVKEKITKGTSDTTFSPLMACTRGQIVTFLWRYFD